MTTSKLVEALVADIAGGPSRRVSRTRFLASALIGMVLCGGCFWLTLGPRDDIVRALHTWRFDFKPAWAISLALVAGYAAVGLTNPRAHAARLAWLLVLPLVILLSGVGLELASTPAATWAAHAVGSNAVICMTSIPLLALVPLVAVLPRLIYGASPAPALSGAMVGLLAGGIAAAFYALQCTDDSPLFVALWYVPAISIGTAIGAVCGRALLRW